MLISVCRTRADSEANNWKGAGKPGLRREREYNQRTNQARVMYSGTEELRVGDQYDGTIDLRNEGRFYTSEIPRQHIRSYVGHIIEDVTQQSVWSSTPNLRLGGRIPAG